MRPAVLSCLLLVAAASSAFAADTREATKHRKAGQAAYEISEYAKAIEEFKKAYALDPDPRIFYNLGLAHMKRFELEQAREDLVQARDYFRRFLNLASSENLKAAERRRLERFRRSAENYLSMLALADEPRPAPAQTSTAAAEPASLPRPTEPEKPQVTVAPVVPPPVETPPPDDDLSLVFFVAGGATAAAAVVTGMFALQGSSNAYRALHEGDYARAESASDRARVLAISTDVLVLVTIAAATVALIVE